MHSFQLQRMLVTPRKRRVSRNRSDVSGLVALELVTPRKRRVSRNLPGGSKLSAWYSHASQEACE